MSGQWTGDEPDVPQVEDDEEPELRVVEHDEGDGLHVPDDVELLEGEVRGTRRGVGIVLSRDSADGANAMLAAALEELDRVHVGREHVTVMLVPGAFELALGAMALAKTRRYSCVVGLGDASGNGVIAAETASGLQLAALETGVPVAFGVLIEPGDAAGRAGEAVRRGLEMADLFQQVRAAARAG
jgi:6,7-dimethyl-8-ribityllumazine synthase